jgi:hypothetical protein
MAASARAVGRRDNRRFVVITVRIILLAIGKFNIAAGMALMWFNGTDEA